MASIRELVVMFDRGELGKLLARTFNGERGHVHPFEDSDLLVVFDSESNTPSAAEIAETVTKHYTEKGYTVTPNQHQTRDCFQAIISEGAKEDGFVGVVITTRYPFPAPGQGCASLRITTTPCV